MHTQQQIFAKVGNYKGMTAAVRRFEISKITLDRAVLLELKQVSINLVVPAFCPSDTRAAHSASAKGWRINDRK